jgi:hypothetical protein
MRRLHRQPYATVSGELWIEPTNTVRVRWSPVSAPPGSSAPLPGDGSLGASRWAVHASS